MKNSKQAPTPILIGLMLSKEDCNSNVNLTLYKSMVGSLIYLTTIQLDMMHAVSLISRFMETLKDSHQKVRKMVLRYVNGTKGFGILYTTNNKFMLTSYTDSDWDRCLDDKKRTCRYMFHMGLGVI